MIWELKQIDRQACRDPIITSRRTRLSASWKLWMACLVLCSKKRGGLLQVKREGALARWANFRTLRGLLVIHMLLVKRFKIEMGAFKEEGLIKQFLQVGKFWRNEQVLTMIWLCKIRETPSFNSHWHRVISKISGGRSNASNMLMSLQTKKDSRWRQGKVRNSSTLCTIFTNSLQVRKIK